MTAEFEKNIKDPDIPVIIDLSYPNRPLLIAFGGMIGGLGIPPFEFFNLTSNLDVNKIYLRDHSLTWYHSGLPGISANIDGTASFLRRKIDESGAGKVVVFGNSMGGYAALLFGILVQADIVHAFSPQTFIHDENYIRSKLKIRYVHSAFPGTFFDLKKVLKSHRRSGTYNLYYDMRDEIDRKQALHVKRFRHVRLHPFSGGGHGLIRVLKDSGELQKIIRSAF